jgi:hypothetical protein
MVPAMLRFLILLVVAMLGCAPPAPRLVYLPDADQPPPITDLPVDLRLQNWIGTDDDGDSGGSCAHASSRNAFRAGGAWYLDDIWARSRGYEGPEYAERLLEKWDREGIPFAATEDGDVEVLEAASRTGRWATIFYYPSHSITFCGFDVVNGVESALLLDNNFIDYYIVVEKRLFLDSWQRVYGGFAAVPWITPAVPRTYPRTYLQSEVAYGTN